MAGLETIIFAAVVFCAIGLAIYHNKKDQSKIMNYYKKTSEDGIDVASESLKNQKEMISLLKEISAKLDKS